MKAESLVTEEKLNKIMQAATPEKGSVLAEVRNMVWEQLEKMGLKPKRKEKTKIEERKEEIEKFIEKIRSDENKRKILALLIKSFQRKTPRKFSFTECM